MRFGMGNWVRGQSRMGFPFWNEIVSSFVDNNRSVFRFVLDS